VVLCRCALCIEDYISKKFPFLVDVVKVEEEEEEEAGGEEKENVGQESLFFKEGRKRGRGQGEESVSLYASAEKAFAETDTLNNTDKLRMIEGYRVFREKFSAYIQQLQQDDVNLVTEEHIRDFQDSLERDTKRRRYDEQ